MKLVNLVLNQVKLHNKIFTNKEVIQVLGFLFQIHIASWI